MRSVFIVEIRTSISLKASLINSLTCFYYQIWVFCLKWLIADINLIWSPIPCSYQTRILAFCGTFKVPAGFFKSSIVTRNLSQKIGFAILYLFQFTCSKLCVRQIPTNVVVFGSNSFAFVIQRLIFVFSRLSV